VPAEEVVGGAIGRKGRKRRTLRPGRIRSRDRRRRSPLPVAVGRTERADWRPKRRAVQRGLLETRVG